MRWSLLLLFTAAFAVNAVCTAKGAEWIIQQQASNIDLFCQFPTDTQFIWNQIKDLANELDESLQVRTNGEPIQILIFSDQPSYLAFLLASVPECRTRKAVFVRKGQLSSIYAYRSRTLITDLRHEMTHAILHQHVPILPLWLDEGLAEYFEDQRDRRANSSRISNVRWKAHLGWTPGLKSLEAISAMDDLDSEAYRDSWAWACLLLNESAESQQLLTNYLQRIHNAEKPMPFSEFAEMALPDLAKRSRSFFRKLSIRTIPANATTSAE